MTDHDLSSSEHENEGETGEEKAPDEFDPIAFGSEYASSPGRREELWNDLPPEQREAVTAGTGIVGPLAVEDDDFRPVTTGTPDYGSIVQRAKAEAEAGMSAVRRGDLDVTSDERAELERLEALADAMPDNGAPLQELAHRLGRLGNAAFEARPFEPVLTRQRTTADGGVVIDEEDAFGRTRVVAEWSAEELASAAQVRDALPWDDPETVTPEEAASWPHADQVRFSREHPEKWEGLKGAASDALDAYQARAQDGIF